MKLRITSLFLFSLVAAAALLSAGCVWGKRSPLAILAGAKQDALATQTVHFTMETSFEGLDDDSPAGDFAFTAEGATDTKDHKGYVVMKISGIEMEMRTLDGKTYTRLFGDTWTESDAGDEDLSPLGSDFDPFDLLESLGVDDSDVKHLGGGELHGKHVERYAVTIDPDALGDEGIGDLVPPGLAPEVEIWIDSDGMPARLSYQFTIEPGAAFGLDNTKTVTFSLALELFDYGKPVEVEAPPADKITDLPDFGAFGGAAADPFAGADCYGERLKDCLDPDPATDAMASNPDLCQGTTARVCLVPVGKVRPDVVKAIVDFHKETKGLDVVVLPAIPLQLSDVDEETSQVTAEFLYRSLKQVYRANNDSASSFVAITGIDVVPEDDQYGWEFGARFGSGVYGNLHGVFSYFRMANVQPYSGQPLTDELLYLRVEKYAARYTAILHLHYEIGDDINLLNYRDMYGFSDLDAMGTTWPPESALKPEYVPTCTGAISVVCVIPDGDYTDPMFLDDLKKVVNRLASEGWPVELYLPRGWKFVPTFQDWDIEFLQDLSMNYASVFSAEPKVTLLGVTDDTFVRPPSKVLPHFEFFRPPSDIALVSAGDAGGTVGTPPHQERLYRMMLRAILQMQYGMQLTDDPSSIMWNGATKPSDLDGKTIPPIPR